MSSSREHYDRFLAGIYTWMCGDFSQKIRENTEFFMRNDIMPGKHGIAVDLGCGPGYQSLALADLGFEVVSFDLSAELLAELERRKKNRPVRCVQDDMLNFPNHCSRFQVAVCMGDSLTHLVSQQEIKDLFRSVSEGIEKGGLFALTFRDLTRELLGVDRIIPVRSDDSRIMTTYLEYSASHVMVHDMLYSKTESGWSLTKSCYPKLRLNAESAASVLGECGFEVTLNETINGLARVVGVKR